MIFLRINLPNFVQFKHTGARFYSGGQAPWPSTGAGAVAQHHINKAELGVITTENQLKFLQCLGNESNKETNFNKKINLNYY